MNPVFRVGRALYTALRMTLRGEKPPESPYAALLAWIKQSGRLADAAFAAADASGMDKAARRKITLVAEGRRTNMETVLASVKFHAGEEYPHLLTTLTPTALGAVYSTNINDRFLVSKLVDALESGAVRDAVEKLARHLESIPPMTV